MSYINVPSHDLLFFLFFHCSTPLIILSQEHLMAEQIRRQQATLARNVQRSAEELRRDSQN